MPFKPKYGAAHGSIRAAQRGGGLLVPEHDQILDEFYRFPEKEARAAFADKWVRLSASKMDVTWKVFYELLRIIRDDRLYEDASFMEDRKARSSFEEYWEQVVQKPFATWMELEKTYHFVSEHYPELLGKTFTEAKKSVPELATIGAMKPLLGVESSKEAGREGGKHGGRGKKNPVAISHRVSTNRLSSTSQERLARRIARDRPDILDRMKAGEFKSVHEAALEAGIIKRKVMIPIDPDTAVRLLTKHFKGEQLDRLIEGLTHWASQSNDRQP